MPGWIYRRVMKLVALPFFLLFYRGYFIAEIYLARAGQGVC